MSQKLSWTTKAYLKEAFSLVRHLNPKERASKWLEYFDNNWLFGSKVLTKHYLGAAGVPVVDSLNPSWGKTDLKSASYEVAL